MTLAIHEFRTTLDPVFGIETHHQARLVVECGVLPGDAGLEAEVPVH